MNNRFRTRSRYPWLWGWALLSCAGIGCASTPKPESLQEAKALMESDDRAELEASKPQLLQEAKESYAKAKRAQRSGDAEAADLYAQRASDRYQTARAYVARDEARALSKNMVRAKKQAGQRVTQLEEEVDEQARFEKLEQRLQDMQNDGQAQVDPAEKQAWQDAKRALARARDRQKAAIEAEAHVRAPELYTSGRSLVENSVSSLGAGLPEDATEAAEMAVPVLDEAILKAQAAQENESQESSEGQSANQVAEAPPKDTARPDRDAAGPEEAQPESRAWGAGSAERRDGGKLAARVEDRLVALQFERSELLAQRADERCTGDFGAFTVTLELAEQRLMRGDSFRAHEFVVRADERIEGCRQRLAHERSERWEAGEQAADDGSGDDGSGPATARQQSKNGRTGRTQQDAAEQQARGKAAAAMTQARALVARSQAEELPEADLAEGKALLASAEGWFKSGDYAQAEQAAKQASAKLEQVGREAKGPPSPQAAGQQAKADQQAAKEGAGSQGEDSAAKAKEEAGQAIAEIQARLAEVASQEGDAQDFAGVDRRVDAAESWYGRQEYPLALRFAQQADEALDELLKDRAAKSGAASDAGKAEQTAEASDKDKDAEAQEVARARERRRRSLMQKQLRRANSLEQRAAYAVTQDTRRDLTSGNRALAEAEKRAAEGDTEGALEAAERASSAFTAVVAAADDQRQAQIDTVVLRAGGKPDQKDPRWELGYRAIYRALALRDEAQRAGGESSESLERADDLLEQARGQWSGKDYAAAGKAATQASVLYEKALADGTDSGPQRGDEQDAETRLQEATLLARICEKQSCADRDGGRTDRAEAALTAAREAKDEGSFLYAAELASQATQGFEAALSSPSEDTTKKDVGSTGEAGSADERERARQALQEARVQRELCEAEGCAQANYEAFIRARETFATATVAMADGRFNEAEEQASRAAELTATARRTQTATFQVPEGVEGVQRSGNRIVVSPRIDFLSGGTALTPGSRTSVERLAATLRANGSAVQGLRIVGHTDSVGDAQKNLTLSETRARAVADALRREGVGQLEIRVEGRGEDEPIADNDTKEGRAKNRRVEFYLSFGELL